MKKKTMTGLIIGLSVATVLAAGGAVGVAAIATNGFKNNEVITPALSMKMVNYGETYTQERVEAAMVYAGYNLKDYKLRSFLDETYWKLNNFKENKSNFLTGTEMKVFTEEESEKIIHVGQDEVKSWGTFGAKVDVAFEQEESFYIRAGEDYDVSIVGDAYLMFNPSVYDLVLSIDASYGVTVVDDEADVTIGEKSIHEDLCTLEVANNKLPLILCFTNAQ